MRNPLHVQSLPVTVMLMVVYTGLSILLIRDARSVVVLADLHECAFRRPSLEISTHSTPLLMIDI
jgi:hypothetical protein